MVGGGLGRLTVNADQKVGGSSPSERAICFDTQVGTSRWILAMDAMYANAFRRCSSATALETSLFGIPSKYKGTLTRSREAHWASPETSRWSVDLMDDVARREDQGCLAM